MNNVLIKAIISILILFEKEARSNNFIINDDWFNQVDQFNEVQFNDHFRMSKKCFNLLMDKILRNHNVKNLKTKLLIFLFFVCNEETYRVLRNSTGTSKSTCFDYINELSVVLSNIAHSEIKLPLEAELPELKELMVGNREDCAAILAIDGTFINIQRPSRNRTAWCNRKKNCSFNFLCVVDGKKRFRGVTYNFGSWHDARLYRRSYMKSYIENLPTPYKVLADQAFSGINLLTTASPTENELLDPTTREFNYFVSSKRMIVERAFGDLKNKFNITHSIIRNGHSKKSN